MTQYFISLTNTYSQTLSPLVFNVGYINQKSPTYNCITKMSNSLFKISPINNDLKIIQNYILQASNEGSYTVQVFDLTALNNPPILFSFYVFQNLFIINDDIILRTINRELPALYSSNNKLNNADNVGTAGVFGEVYRYIYTLFYNSTTSIGINSSYNPELEKIYIGVNNFLQNAKYPAQFLKTLMNINTQCSVQGFSIAITLSKLIYQFTGSATPVQVVYNTTSKKYNIKIYYVGFVGWSLGEIGNSELGQTTILGSSISNPFLWIIQTISNRLMPAFVNFEIFYLPDTTFEIHYDTSIVSPQDFYNPAIIYDAYKVVNNNNVFNTQGFLLKP